MDVQSLLLCQMGTMLGWAQPLASMALPGSTHQTQVRPISVAWAAALGPSVRDLGMTGLAKGATWSAHGNADVDPEDAHLSEAAH